MAVVWCNGKRRAYGSTWTKVRAIILDRDASFHDGIRTCECCGAVEGDRAYTPDGRAIWKLNEKTGKRNRVMVVMEVDHILPFVHGGGEFDIDNLITLCRQCNRRNGDAIKSPELALRLFQLAYDRNRAILGGGGE